MRCRLCGTGNVDDAIACVACAQALRTPTLQTNNSAHPTPVELGPLPTKRERSPSLPSSARTEGGGAKGDEEEVARFADGDVVLGTYVIERQLGKGGMGTVYLGRDDVSGQRVAIKVLPGALAREKDIRDRFIQEARSLAALDHPGIVPLITFAQDGDDRFLVMKYVAGRPLERVLNEVDVLEPSEARRLLREVVAALGYAHEKGVVHRDIKPANVLVDDNGRVVVVDFGIARKLESAKRLTQTGMLMGTPQYMSPEQIEGRLVDGRADLYACGLLLFEMLAGRPPFDAEKTFDILKAHVEKPVPDLRALRTQRKADASAVPDDLVALCHALLEKDPDKRPQSGRDVVDALDGRTAFALPPPTEPEIPAARSLKPRATTETPALAFTDAGPLDSFDDDDEPIQAPSNPARRWAAFFVVVFALGAVYVFKFGNPLAGPAHDFFTSSDNAVVDAGVADPFDMGVLLSRARVAYEKGKYDDARYAVDTALHLQPTNVEALLLRARILVGGNNKPAASETLARLPSNLDEAQAQERAAIEALITPPAKVRPRATIDERREKTTPPKKAPKPKETSSSSSSSSSSKPRPTDLPDETLARITRATKDKLSNCYVEHVLVVDASAEGEVAVAVSIANDGTVTGVSVKQSPFASSDFNACLIDAIKSWKFPAFDGEPEMLGHQFNFHPG